MLTVVATVEFVCFAGVPKDKVWPGWITDEVDKPFTVNNWFTLTPDLRLIPYKVSPACTVYCPPTEEVLCSMSAAIAVAVPLSYFVNPYCSIIRFNFA